MKKHILILMVILFLHTQMVEAQSIQQLIFLAPNSSFFNSSNSDAYPNKGMKPINYWNFGTSVGYKIEYYFPKVIAIGTSLQYMVSSAELYTPSYCLYPLDRIFNIRNLITSNSIDFPLYFKIRSSNNKSNYTYFQSGFGLSWIFNTHRIVEEETNFDLIKFKNPIREKIADESFDMKNENNTRIGAYFQVGIGHGFQIKNINLFVELLYKHDLNYWKYETMNTPLMGIQEFPIKKHSISLEIGMAINNKK